MALFGSKGYFLALPQITQIAKKIQMGELFEGYLEIAHLKKYLTQRVLIGAISGGAYWKSVFSLYLSPWKGALKAK